MDLTGGIDVTRRLRTAALCSLMLAACALGIPARVALSQTTFTTPVNNASSVLAADHAAGSGTLVLRAGDGALFGTPSPSAPVRVTVASRPTLAGGQIVPNTTKTIYQATARTGDTLSGLSAIEGTADRAYRANDPVAVLVTAGMLSEIQGAVNSAAVSLATKADDSAVLHVSGSETVAGAKTFSTLPTLGTLTGIAKVTGGSLSAATAGTDYSAPAVAETITGARTIAGVPLAFDASANALIGQNVQLISVGAGLSQYGSGVSKTLNSNGTTFNPVFSQGWNITAGGGLLDPTKPAFRIGMEENFFTAGKHQSEGHLFATLWPNELETRPITISTVTTDGYPGDVSILMCAKRVSRMDAAGAATVWDDTWDGTSCSYSRYYPSDPSHTAFAYFSGTTTDVMTVGRPTVAASIILLGTSPGITLTRTAGGTASILNDGTLELVAPSDGKQTFYRADTHTFFNRSTTVTIGFLDATGLTLYAGGGVAMFEAGPSGIKMGAGTPVKGLYSATAALDFGPIAAGASAELTIAVAGAVAGSGSTVELGPPATLETGLQWGGRVSAADTVSVRLVNVTGSPIDPASATWRATIKKY